jgi:ribosomal protein S12 methylthiotransferase accessory factor
MMEVSFPGGVAVEATFHGHTVRTDQPSPQGDDSAMSPFDLFFASLATCMGFYALRFCQERGIETKGLAVKLKTQRDETKKRVAKVAVDLTLPEGFPEKYRDAILRAVDHCAVKRHVLEPPEFAIEIR